MTEVSQSTWIQMLVVLSLHGVLCLWGWPLVHSPAERVTAHLHLGIKGAVAWGSKSRKMLVQCLVHNRYSGNESGIWSIYIHFVKISLWRSAPEFCPSIFLFILRMLVGACWELASWLKITLLVTKHNISFSRTSKTSHAISWKSNASYVF